MVERVKYIAIHFFSYFALQTFMRLVMVAVAFSAVSTGAANLVETFVTGLPFDFAAGLFYVLPVTVAVFLLPEICYNVGDCPKTHCSENQSPLCPIILPNSVNDVPHRLPH